MTARELQQEVVETSRLIYSPRNLLKAVIHKRGIERMLFVGEYLWQLFQRHDLLEELRADPSILDE